MAHGFPQVAVLIRFKNGLVHGSPDITSGDAHVLTDFDEQHCQTAVLTNGQFFIVGDFGVFQNQLQGAAAPGRGLTVKGIAQRLLDSRR